MADKIKVNPKKQGGEPKKKNGQSNASHIKWTRPIAQALRDLGGSGTPAEVRAKIVENEHLTEEEISVIRGKTKVNKFKNEVAFARNDLAAAGYIDKSIHGIWILTEAGKTVDITDEMASDLFKNNCAEATAKRNDSSEALPNNGEAAAKSENEAVISEEPVRRFNGYRNPYSAMLIKSKNIILRGAPGTGKTYLAKEIAADIISKGAASYAELSPEQKKQVEFVQFHPSYDYSDFVEGLRPILNDDGTMIFKLQDGIFKKFIAQAGKNYENSKKSPKMIKKELSAQEAMNNFFSNIEYGATEFETVRQRKFVITKVDDNQIHIFIPENLSSNKLKLPIDEIRKMLESDNKFEKPGDVTEFFARPSSWQEDSYEYIIFNEIKKAIHAKKMTGKTYDKPVELKNYVFIIDEINRGEISKIFGELFFAVDPGYRGRDGEVSTQYANLHFNPDEKFYIPENVYIIGTMNDIDRSVDSFDFAMRRRFRFIELKADEHTEMLASLEDEKLETEAKKRMKALNKKIAETDGLNENYQIGAAYFLKLKALTFDELWTDYLKPLLQDYINGMSNEADIMKGFEEAYGYKEPSEGNPDEATEN